MRVLVLSIAVIATSCGAAEEKQAATITYDSGKSQTLLFSYPLEPAPESRDIEKFATRENGRRVRASSLDRYFCFWRPAPGPIALLRSERAVGAPEEIDLFCVFGTSPWTLPTGSIPKVVSELEKRQEAVLVMKWKRQGTEYALLNFTLEIRGPKGDFRSTNRGKKDLSQIHLLKHDVKFPASPQESLSFNLSASMPYRLNAGEPPKKQVYSVKIQGVALPRPDWLMQ